MAGPRILALDIETAPLLVDAWGVYEQNVGLNQVVKDWSILSWSAKWVGEKKIYHGNTFNQKNKRDDKKMLKGIYKLIEEADIVLTQNGKMFDLPKLCARFIVHGFKPLPAEQEHIDTRQLAGKGRFKFTSASLEWLCKVLKTKHQKLKHKRFPGHELWREVLKGNKKACADMSTYNDNDVLCLEDVFMKLRPWGIGAVKINKYFKDEKPRCPACGSASLIKYGYAYKGEGKFQRYRCDGCSALVRGKENLLSKNKRKMTLVKA